MIFVYIHFAIAILDFILLFLVSAKAEHIFKTRYPDMVIPKSHWSEKAITLVKTTLAFICPLFNAVCLWVCLSQTDDICENTVNKCWLQCLREAKKNESIDSTSCDIPSP